MRAYYVYSEDKRYVVTAKSEEEARKYFVTSSGKEPYKVESVKETQIVWATLWREG